MPAPVERVKKEGFKNLLQRLGKLGFKNTQDRKAYLDERKAEIEAFFKEHTLKETQEHFHVGSSALRRLGLLPKRKIKKIKSKRMVELEARRGEIEAYLQEHTVKETLKYFKMSWHTLKKMGLCPRRKVKRAVIHSKGTVTSAEAALDMLPPEVSIGDLVNEGFRRLIQRINALEKEQVQYKREIAALKEQLEEKERIIKECNEALDREKGSKVTLGDLQQATKEARQE